MLECHDVVVAYGRIQALRGVSLRVQDAQVVSIVGANGAGKTTLLRAIMGLQPISVGSIRLDGTPIERKRTHQISRMGVALVPAGGSLFSNLSVAQNLALATHSRRRSNRPGVASDMEQVLTLFPTLTSRLSQKVRTLSGGEQQMVAIGRALMARPRLLLLDEPSFGLAPAVLDQILAALRRLNADGMTVLLVEQNARIALEFAQVAYVLASGQVVASGPTDELRSRESVESLYFGGEANGS